MKPVLTQPCLHATEVEAVFFSLSAQKLYVCHFKHICSWVVTFFVLYLLPLHLYQNT